MSGYTKLFGSIIASTIWREPDHIRVVWITLLAMSDSRGFVAASVPGLADLARVSIAQCEQALTVLKGPDSYSRTKDHEGRRIADEDGGFLILNHRKYRDMLSAEDRRDYHRKYYQQVRKVKSQQVSTISTISTPTQQVSTDSRHTDSDTDTDSEASKSTLGVQPSFALASEPSKSPDALAEEVYAAYPRKVARPAALRAISKAVARHGYEHVLNATRRYSEAVRGSDPAFIPHPATFYTQERYNDSPQTWKPSSKAKPTEPLPNHEFRSFIPD